MIKVTRMSELLCLLVAEAAFASVILMVAGRLALLTANVCCCCCWPTCCDSLAVNLRQFCIKHTSSGLLLDTLERQTWLEFSYLASYSSVCVFFLTEKIAFFKSLNSISLPFLSLSLGNFWSSQSSMGGRELLSDWAHKYSWICHTLSKWARSQRQTRTGAKSSQR